MRIRSFIIAYALVLAILLFADRRPGSNSANRYSHVIDLTGTPLPDRNASKLPTTRIVAPAELIPGTWSAGQIPPERLIAPLVVINLVPRPDEPAQLSLADIAEWESKHGVITQGALVAIRRSANKTSPDSVNPFVAMPITADAAQFLMDARFVVGFVMEDPSNLAADRPLARQIALHGSYVVDGATRFSDLSETGSLAIVAPAKKDNADGTSVRILAMVK